MSGFVRATIAFPTVLFTLGLIAVLFYWLGVLLGRIEPNLTGPRNESFAADKFSDIPPAIVFTSLAAQGWFWSLLGATLYEGGDHGGFQEFCTRVFIAVIALCLAYVGTLAVAFAFRRIRAARR
ncbi:hypothetical protein [Nocardia veterana]|uniref:Uncharacterized protein n=1 Tax=Nocardia veterana TaxID=132249 RepID=A0A7X6M2B6_9NOCA|nr:hypothetical protein [Nocardia veterana]NKY88993.1 hypothetical protein [Nocardia veterana]